MNKFSEFLEQAYLTWQQESGKRKTLDNFAEYIGEKRPLISAWLNGSRRPGPEKIERLAELFGLEIYDALDLPRPDPRLTFVQRNWEKAPLDVQLRVAEEIAKYTADPIPDGEENKAAHK